MSSSNYETMSTDELFDEIVRWARDGKGRSDDDIDLAVMTINQVTEILYDRFSEAIENDD